MPADLINITNIVLSDDFETWFERTNEVIDALNPLQLYDFYDLGYTVASGVSPTIPGYTTVGPITPGTSLGLKITRDIRYDGDMLIEVLPETPLGFNTTTGALTLVFTGPTAPPAIATCGQLANDDLFLVHDVSASATKTIEASYMLAPTVMCNHSFGDGITPVTITIEGDLIVNGTQTILNTQTVESLDHQIDLNAADAVTITDASNYVSGEDLIVGETVTGGTSGETATVFSWSPVAPGNPGSLLVVTNPTGAFSAGEVITGGTSGFSITEGGQADAPGTPAGDDSVAGAGAGGGIRLLSTSGNKTILWDDADNRWHINVGSGGFQIDLGISLFTRTIEPLTDHLDIIGSGTGDAVAVHWHESGEPEHWRITLKEDTGSGQSAYAFPYPGDPLNPNPVAVNADGTLALEHSTGADGAEVYDLQIYFDSVTPTYDVNITGWARNLNADLLDGAHASITPAANAIPIARTSGTIDPGWLDYIDNLVVAVTQTAHGFIFGDVVRLTRTPETPLPGYTLAQADNLANAEAVGIVSKIIDANTFELTLRGYIVEPNPGDWAASKVGAALIEGEAYFLDKTTAGKMTNVQPSGGDIQKGMMVAIGTTDALVMNYVGGLTDPLAGSVPTVTLANDVLGTGPLTGPITTTIVERTLQLPTVSGPTSIVVEDETGAGHRTFEILLVGNASLDIVPPTWPSVPGATNSITLIITQDGVGGWTPTITVLGGTIIWDNSLVQPPHQTIANKTTIYVLINVDGSTNWYGSRAVFEL